MANVDAPSRRVVRRRLSDEVVSTLRAMILTRELPPGTGVTQDELAQRLGVSTTPVREALLRLAAEGFVDMSPNRTFSVVPVTKGDIRDVYWLTAIIQGELARRATEVADPELIEELRSYERAYDRAAEAGDSEAMETANWNFHRAINRAANAPKLLSILNSTLRFIPRDFYRIIPDWVDEAGHGHGDILEAIERGDAEAARVETEAHMREAGERLAASLEDLDG